MGLYKRAQRKKLDSPDIGRKRVEFGCGWESIKRVLMGSIRCRGKKWEEDGGSFGRWEKRLSPSEEMAMPLPTLLMEMEGREIAAGGWQSHNSVSPVWQRPILMGEKCELPRFSGLILYDERGRLLQDSGVEDSCTGITQQGKTVVRTTLKDLL